LPLEPLGASSMRVYSALALAFVATVCVVLPTLGGAVQVDQAPITVPQVADFPPIPRLSVAWRGVRRIRNLTNEDFLKGHIYTLGEKIWGFRRLLHNATNEMAQMRNLTMWHHDARNLTHAQWEDVTFKYEQAKLTQTLLKRAGHLLKRELKMLQRQFNASSTPGLSKIENQIKEDLLAIGSSPRALSQILATLAVQRAMKRVTALYRRYVHFLQRLAARRGKTLTLTVAAIDGFNDAVKRISEELKDLDGQVLKLRRKTSRHLRRAILKRGHERAKRFAVKKLKAGVADEKKRLHRAKKMYKRTKEAIKNFK